MFGDPRIGLKPLTDLCRRLATSLGAGVDVRTVFMRETSMARGAGRSRMDLIRQQVSAGETIGDALDHTGNYFPEFFRAVIKVGEESGHLPEVLRQLADNYDHQLKLRRSLLGSLAWPLLELTLALGVVGILIWVMGALPQLKKSNVDLLGFGLTGTSGLLTYLGFLAMVAAAMYVVYQATVRGVLWVAPLQRVLMSLPQLGRALQTVAMARLTWAMHVTLNSGMDLRPALEMSLNSTRNVVYTQHVPRILQSIRQGREIHEALRDTNEFPIDLLDAIQVGEESGKLVESMRTVSEHYQEAARRAMNTIAILLGVVVTGLIAALIIFLIFRLFSSYTGMINDAVKMR